MSRERETDRDLVRLAREGDRRAMGELVIRYERVVSILAFQKVGNREDAEDVAQETFLRAFAALDDLKDAARFGSWLYGIALRASHDHHRRRARRGGGTVGLEDLEPASVEPRVDENAARREEAERVVAALGELPDLYRIVLTLRYLNMMGYEEIADHLGEPQGTIANRIHRAVNMLRERLREIWNPRPTR